MNFALYFKSRQGEMARLLKEIVSRESPSQDKKAVDNCSSFVVQEFKKIGLRITRFPQKDTGDLHLAEYTRPGQQAKSGKILVLTHIDTVWPIGKIEKMPFYISGDKIFGPGVLDMKSGLVMTIFSLKALNDLGIRPAKKIAVLINSAEEIGSEASHNIIRSLARNSSLVLCLEPSLPGGALKTQRKGRLVIRLEVKGRSAHAGNPEKGVSAIEELISQLRSLKKIQKAGVTASIGQIGGGEKVNIVAENAWAAIDLRFWNSLQKDKIISHFKQLNPSLSGARIKYRIESLTPPMEKNRASSNLFLEAKNIAESLGMTLEEGKTGGGSDASIASGLGVPTLDGLGADGDGMHAEHEHLLLSSLVQRTALLTELLRQF